MFAELMPLLASRTVLITVAKVDDSTLRVNVIPTQASADENPALATPLTFTGSPEELDAELGKHLARYVQTHQQTASTLALPQRIGNRALTSLQHRLVKTSGRLVKHARYYWLLLAESHLTRRLFASMLGRIAGPPLPAG